MYCAGRTSSHGGLPLGGGKIETALKLVAAAYGPTGSMPNPLSDFQQHILDDWRLTRKYWPRQPTPQHSRLLERLKALCTNLEMLRSNAAAEDWTEEKLLECLGNELVCPSLVLITT